jgi:transcriptional regulator with XRE-family HTH domain
MAATIRDLRRKAGVSQRVLAKRCAVAPRSIGAIERGKQVPTIEMLEHIAWGLDSDYLTISTLAAGRLPQAG